MTFVRIGDLVVSEDQIVELDCSRLESLVLGVRLRSGRVVEVRDQQAMDVVMLVKPSAFEGKRFRFARQAWAFHNLVAHPLLQVLAWAGLHKLGFRVHDATVPRPKPLR